MNKTHEEHAANMQPLNMYLTGYIEKGKIFIELRKKIQLCPDNNDLIKEIVTAALSNTPIKSEVNIQLRDKLIAKIFWNKHKPNWFVKKEK